MSVFDILASFQTCDRYFYFPSFWQLLHIIAIIDKYSIISNIFVLHHFGHHVSGKDCLGYFSTHFKLHVLRDDMAHQTWMRMLICEVNQTYMA